MADGRPNAISLPCWLRVEPVDRFRSMRWIRLRYQSSLFDQEIRPLIRFSSVDGASYIETMNQAILGNW